MDYIKLMELRNSTNAFGNYLNIKIKEIKKGYARAEMPVTPACLNPVGSVHGGCLFTIADIAAGAAASSYGFHVTTVDGSFHYLRPGLNTGRLTAVTREIKAGKKLMSYDVSVTDQDEKLLAEGIFTYMALDKKIDL